MRFIKRAFKWEKQQESYALSKLIRNMHVTYKGLINFADIIPTKSFVFTNVFLDITIDSHSISISCGNVETILIFTRPKQKLKVVKISSKKPN
ncbi:CLUMA_CG008191, isoform A [Clunio marinus]|uniref:CLUMA_CG008191, isoform A n=1 Tax=Clunio marinus TaxID=568069 RepID=A0A1J1I3C0_9DIPT|nr:CLUMA_CG008191, isoform A [Clunio marinus]